MGNIFDNSPSTWQDLEERVKQTFSEMDFETDRNVSIQTVRNKVNVDVVAIDKGSKPQTIIYAECKDWTANVNQNVVHAFRTVVQDAGAHIGIIISSSAFQSGALDAAKNSNILLMSWTQFQEYFYDRWFDTMLAKVCEYADPVNEYYDYFGPITRGLGEGTNGRTLETNVAVAQKLQRRYAIFNRVFKYTQMIHKGLSFPFHDQDPSSDNEQQLLVETPRYFFDLILNYRDEALGKFEAFTRGEI
jgi:hypothetical protein